MGSRALAPRLPGRRPVPPCRLMTRHRIPPELAERASQLASAGAVGASVAHELRNSLAVAESSLFLARRDSDEKARLVAHLEKASGEIRRAQEVIGAVLGLARGDAIALEPLPILTVLDAARASVVLPTNVTLQTTVEPRDLVVRCNGLLLERVLSNLYANAIEAFATRSRGAIVTRVTADTERVHIVVEDDGPGIPNDVLDSIFDPLVTTKSSGTGLGLALCRAIAKAHAGDIEAGPSKLGGAAFSFWLPR